MGVSCRTYKVEQQEPTVHKLDCHVLIGTTPPCCDRASSSVKVPLLTSGGGGDGVCVAVCVPTPLSLHVVDTLPSSWDMPGTRTERHCEEETTKWVHCMDYTANAINQWVCCVLISPSLTDAASASGWLLTSIPPRPRIQRESSHLMHC